MRLPSAAPLLAALVAASAAPGLTQPALPPGPLPSALDWPEVGRLARARDFFTLRDRLAAAPAATPAARYARALVEHALNRPAESNATAAALLAAGGLPDSVAAALRQLQVNNALRLGAYAAGLAITDTLLARPAGLSAADRRDLANGCAIFRALAGVPAQTVAVGGPFTLRVTGGRAPVRVGDSARHYIFDTGANLSTMMRSEARALGLRPRPAGVEVGTATGRRVRADLAVADRLAVGRAEFRHVVFLVVDDSLLTFPDGFRIPALVGFPVISALGEVQFGRDSTLAVPWPAPPRSAGNLALEGLAPLTRLRWADAPGPGGAPLICMLDTGANDTQFYAPFYRRFRARLDSTTRPATRRSGGVGGYVEHPVRVLRPVRLAVGDTAVRLDSADVLTRPIARDPDDDSRDCNLGQDVLQAFPRYVVNFRDMAFLLR